MKCETCGDEVEEVLTYDLSGVPGPVSNCLRCCVRGPVSGLGGPGGHGGEWRLGWCG